MNHNNRHPAQAGLAALIIALLLAASANADSGVCQVCPAGYDCSSGTPVMGGADGQILVKENGVTVWKYISEVAAQGPQGDAGEPACPGGSTTVESKVESCKCYCRLKGQDSCVSSWVYNRGPTIDCSRDSVCSSECSSESGWRSQVTW